MKRQHESIDFERAERQRRKRYGYGDVENPIRVDHTTVVDIVSDVEEISSESGRDHRSVSSLQFESDRDDVDESNNNIDERNEINEEEIIAQNNAKRLRRKRFLDLVYTPMDGVPEYRNSAPLLGEVSEDEDMDDDMDDDEQQEDEIRRVKSAPTGSSLSSLSQEDIMCGHEVVGNEEPTAGVRYPWFEMSLDQAERFGAKHPLLKLLWVPGNKIQRTKREREPRGRLWIIRNYVNPRCIALLYSVNDIMMEDEDEKQEWHDLVISEGSRDAMMTLIRREKAFWIE